MVGLFFIREILISAMEYSFLNAMSITVLSLELRGHCRRGWKDSKSQRQWWAPMVMAGALSVYVNTQRL